MTTQTEQALENSLITQLTDLGYERIPIRDTSDLLANLKSQLELFNNVNLSDKEMTT